MKKIALFCFCLYSFGCRDKAKNYYIECGRFEMASNWASAVEACKKAIETDPDSPSGKAASEKVKFFR